MNVSQVLESMECGACITDVRRKKFPLLWSNRRFAEITGYTGESLAGRDPWFLHTGLCPEAEELMKSLVARGKKCRGIIQIQRADGLKRWVEVTGIPAREEGSLRLFGTINEWSDEWQEKFARLTPTQERAFSLLANGVRAPEVAMLMRVSLGTAYRTKRDILARLGMEEEDDFVSLYLLQLY